MQPLQRRVLHLEATSELLDEQTAVRTQRHLARAELECAFEASDRGGVLGNVVGGDADPLGDLRQHRAVGAGDRDPDAGRPGVAARRSVARDDQTKTTIRRQYSHLFTPSMRFR
jgi:hypothetical protein